MKQLKLQNKYIQSLYMLLNNYEWKGSKQTRAVRKLKRLLERKHKELQEDKKEIVKQYVRLTENGEIYFDENDTWETLPGKKQQLNKELEELSEEVATLEYGEYVNDISKVYEILDKSETKFSGQEADALVEFLEAYEDSKEEEK
jgi:hypothetical protein